MVRLTIIRFSLALIAASVLGCAAPGGQAAASLETAMRGFVEALQNEDAAALGEFFPSQGEWTLTSTIGGPEARSRHTGAEARRALSTGTGLYDTLIESDGGGDTLRDFVEMSDGRAWTSAGRHRFSPPDVFDDPQRLYVRWRQEQGRWVVDTIALPFS